MTGKLIAFDGLDGSGLTDQVEMLREHLRQSGCKMESVAFTAEPSQGPAGTVLRQALEGRLNVGEEVMALLFAADRADHLERFISPRLKAGIHVVCDRYYLSFLAYQAYTLPQARDWLWQINARNRIPDLTVFLDTPVEICLERIRNRFTPDRYDQPSILQGVNQEFRRVIPLLRSERNENVCIMDSSGSIESVHQKIVELVVPIFFESRD